MKTIATALKGPFQIESIERELELGPDDVLVKSHLAGICGTDKNFYQGRFPKMNGPGYEKDDPLIKFPFFIGHEGGGVVQEVGARVKKFRPDDFVINFKTNGTMAEYFIANEDNLEPVSEGISQELACLGEPIACAMFSGLHSNVNLGDTVVVYGVGFAGQIIAQVMKNKGAESLIVVDVVDEKLKVAQELGADHLINALHGDPVEQILELTHGQGADVVAEVAGVPATLNNSIASVRHNGTLVFYSWMTQEVNINMARLHHDSLTVINTGLVHHTESERSLWTPWALRPVAQGTIQIDPLINRRFPIDQVAEAFRVDSEDQAAIKVVLDF